MTLDSGLRRNDVPGILLRPNIFEPSLEAVLLNISWHVVHYNPVQKFPSIIPAAQVAICPNVPGPA